MQGKRKRRKRSYLVLVMLRECVVVVPCARVQGSTPPEHTRAEKPGLVWPWRASRYLVTWKWYGRNRTSHNWERESMHAYDVHRKAFTLPSAHASLLCPRCWRYAARELHPCITQKGVYLTFYLQPMHPYYIPDAGDMRQESYIPAEQHSTHFSLSLSKSSSDRSMVAMR
jgi:hypothetical protein